MSKDFTFNPGDFVVYPAHGVGQVSERQSASIAGKEVDLLAIHFEKDKFTMRIPSENAVSKGLRSVSSPAVMETVVSTLKTQVKTKRLPWSKRSAEYVNKIGSGDPIALAEVVRELYRDPTLATANYSEKQLYEKAFSRLAPEYAVVQKISETEAIVQLENILQSAGEKQAMA
jgi:CarD family transcriptional regulator